MDEDLFDAWGEELAGDDDDPGGDASELAITDVLDLHSFPPREVKDLVRHYLDEAHAAGLRDLRIIHGKGIGVQRETVRAILASDPRVEWYGDPQDASGWGATRVRLR